MTRLRSTMFRCGFSRRRSRKRYRNRVSSGNSASLLTCSGSDSAADCRVSSSTTSSISPVGSRGLTAAGARGTTFPATVITLSSRSASAALNSGLELSSTHWVIP